MLKSEFVMVNLSIFAETLGDLIFDNKLNGKMLAKKLEISAPTVTRYLRAERTPNIENLIKIADYFNRSTDYLLGFEEEKDNLTFKKCPPFSEQIEFLAKHFKKSFYSFYREVKIPESTFFEWKNGSSLPTLDSIIKIAEHFGCSVDFVLGREK